MIKEPCNMIYDWTSDTTDHTQAKVMVSYATFS